MEVGHRLFDRLSLVAYGLLVFSSLHFHEPWADELQAWLLARDSSLGELFSIRLRYEGTPGLWHLLLWIVTRFTENVKWLNIVSVLVAFVTAGLIIFASPLPAWARRLMPFTFYLGYQYAAVARSYTLASLAIVLSALTFERRLERPLPYVLCLLLLANTSSHGILIAAGFALYDLPFAPTSSPPWREKKALLKMTPVFVVGILIALAQFIPQPQDYLFSNIFSFKAGAMYEAVDQAFASFAPLSILILGLSVTAFAQARILRLFLAPTVILLLFFAIVHFAAWHAGLLFLIWFFCVWQAYTTPLPPRSRRILNVAVVLFIAINLAQTVVVYINDLKAPYSGILLAAQSLEEQRIPDEDVLLLPYGGGLLGAYRPRGGTPSYHLWDRQTGLACSEKLLAKPPFVLLPIPPGQNQEQTEWVVAAYAKLGYKVDRVFPGALWWKFGVTESSSLTLFKHIEPYPSSRRDSSGAVTK